MRVSDGSTDTVLTEEEAALMGSGHEGTASNKIAINCVVLRTEIAPSTNESDAVYLCRGRLHKLGERGWSGNGS